MHTILARCSPLPHHVWNVPCFLFTSLFCFGCKIGVGMASGFAWRNRAVFYTCEFHVCPAREQTLTNHANALFYDRFGTIFPFAALYIDWCNFSTYELLNIGRFSVIAVLQAGRSLVGVSVWSVSYIILLGNMARALYTMTNRETPENCRYIWVPMLYKLTPQPPLYQLDNMYSHWPGAFIGNISNTCLAAWHLVC